MKLRAMFRGIPLPRMLQVPPTCAANSAWCPRMRTARDFRESENDLDQALRTSIRPISYGPKKWICLIWLQQRKQETGPHIAEWRQSESRSHGPARKVTSGLIRIVPAAFSLGIDPAEAGAPPTS
jgi:hypothetical protein